MLVAARKGGAGPPDATCLIIWSILRDTTEMAILHNASFYLEFSSVVSGIMTLASVYWVYMDFH